MHNSEHMFWFGLPTEICPDCKGTGEYVSALFVEPCQRCAGAKVILKRPQTVAEISGSELDGCAGAVGPSCPAGNPGPSLDLATLPLPHILLGTDTRFWIDEVATVDWDVLLAKLGGGKEITLQCEFEPSDELRCAMNVHAYSIYSSRCRHCDKKYDASEPSAGQARFEYDNDPAACPHWHQAPGGCLDCGKQFLE